MSDENVTREEAEAIIKTEIAKAIAKTFENIKAGRPPSEGLVAPDAEDVSDLIPKAETAEVIWGRFNAKKAPGAPSIQPA